MPLSFPYKKFTERLLSGGLSWNQPGDSIQQQVKTEYREVSADAIQVSNFRPHQDGSLRQRMGLGVGIYTAPAAINMIFRRTAPSASKQYVGTVNGDLIDATGGSGMTLASGFDSNVSIFLVYWLGYLWATTQGKQLKLQGTTAKPWAVAPPASCTVTPAAGGILSLGTKYTYWITYITLDGQESNPVTATFTPSGANQSATITAPPDPMDGQTTSWNLYRSGNTLNTAYLVNQGVLTLGSPNFVDDGGLDDAYLLANASAIEVDHDAPPPAAGVAGPYFGKLLMWNSAAHPNRLWWSRTLKPYAFPGALLTTGNWVDCGEDGDPILNVIIRPRYALIYKSNQIWRLAGDPDDLNSDIEPVISGYGLAAPKAIASIGSSDVFLGGDGIYSFSGDGVPVKQTRKIEPIFLGESPDIAGIGVIQGLAENRSSCVMVHRSGRIFFSYPEGSFTSNTATLQYHLASQRWYQDDRAFTALCDEGQAGALLGAGMDNTLRDIEDQTTDNGTAITVQYHSRYLDQDLPENQKTYADVVIDANTGGANVTVFAFYDNGAFSEPIGTINTSSRGQRVFALNYSLTAPFTGDLRGWRAKNIAIRLEGDSTGSPLWVYGITIHYYEEARDSLTFDSGIIDFGSNLVKDVDLLEFVIEASGNVIVQVDSDLPGLMMSSRFTWTIGATTTRQHVEIPILTGGNQPTVVEGRLFRITLISATTFKLYSVRARYRAIGVYVSGAIHDTFLTQELAL